MSKYKLIKNYPGSGIVVGKILDFTNTNEIIIENTDGFTYTYCLGDCQLYPEFWELVVEKDYEILSFVHDGSHGVPLGFKINITNGWLESYDRQVLPLSHYLESSCWKINSVKRLSDGGIFTINDKLDGFDVTTKISLFRIENNQMKVGIREVGVVSLSACKHKKNPILVTEDGKEIFEGDRFSYVNYLLSPFLDIVAYPNHSTKDGMHCFSIPKLALEYIEDNKPQFSKKDMINFVLDIPLDLTNTKDIENWFDNSWIKKK